MDIAKIKSFLFSLLGQSLRLTYKYRSVYLHSNYKIHIKSFKCILKYIRTSCVRNNISNFYFHFYSILLAVFFIVNYILKYCGIVGNFDFLLEFLAVLKYTENLTQKYEDVLTLLCVCICVSM